MKKKEIKPNKVAIRRWVTALRSGKYEQGVGQLRTGSNRYCCLGVACNVHSRTKEGMKWRAEFYGSAKSVLPVRVQKWLGLNSADPEVGGFDLTDLNDQERWSFKKIANHIEKYLLKPTPKRKK